MMDIAELPSFLQTIRLALRLDEQVFVAVQNADRGIWIALTVVFLASASEALGQSVVLLINRVRPRRFILALGISTASQLVGYLLWSITVWLIATYLFDADRPLLAVASAVGLAYAPQLLAFFELTPFLGNGFAVLLSLWSMLAIIVAVNAGLDLLLWQAALTGALSWAVIQLWRRSMGRPIYALGNWLQRRAAGAPLTLTLKDVPQLRKQFDLFENWESWRTLLSRANLERIQERLKPGGAQEETKAPPADEEPDASPPPPSDSDDAGPGHQEGANHA